MNKNQVLTSRFESAKEKLQKIYHRRPYKELRGKPEIEKIIFPEPHIMYQIINKFEKSKEIKIPKGLGEPKLKKINSLNEFSRKIYQFNKDELTDIKNGDIKEETTKFLKKKLQLIKR